MDDHRFRISPQQLYQPSGAASAPPIIGIRDAGAFATNPTLIVGGVRCAPETVERWRREICSCDDHEMPERGMLLYDALYTWRRSEVAHAR